MSKFIIKNKDLPCTKDAHEGDFPASLTGSVRFPDSYAVRVSRFGHQAGRRLENALTCGQREGHHAVIGRPSLQP